MQTSHDITVLQSYADLLYNAEQTRVAIEPLTSHCPSLTVDDAYFIQLENVRRCQVVGHLISGKKIGLTSEGIQKQLGVNEPDYGHLFELMDCGINGIVPISSLIQPKIEGEIAFVLKKDLSGGQVTPQDVINATAYVTVAFEIVDSRIANWNIKLPDTIADNASSGRYILSQKRIVPTDIDLTNISMVMHKNATQVGTGSSAAVMGNPSQTVAWLANKLWQYNVPLKAGELILSGAFAEAHEAKKGDVFNAKFSSLGSVTARFV